MRQQIHVHALLPVKQQSQTLGATECTNFVVKPLFAGILSYMPS